MKSVARLLALSMLGAVSVAVAVESSAAASAVGTPAALAEPPPQKIVVDARGPLALVEVTRTIAPEPAEPGAGSEAILDLAIPDGGALVSVEVRDGGRWRDLAPAPSGTVAAEVYRTESAARNVTPASEPYDESATHRLRLVRAAGHGTAPFTVRYRFAVVPAAAGGRLALRFAAATERLPSPAEVTVRLRGAADAEIAGARVPVSASGDATGRASTRGAWEISWAPRDPAPPAKAPPLEARMAVAAVGPGQTALAFLARRPPAPPTPLAPSVLFLIDRSRSVGLPGLSAERDLVHALLDALPPATSFDALFFDRGTKRLFPMSRPATRQAMEMFEAEMVPDRLQNGTDLPAALTETGALLRRDAPLIGPRVLLVLVTDGALGDGVDGAALDRALGATPGLDVQVAALTIRPVDDEPVGPRARDALEALASARGGVSRAIKSSEIGDSVPAALADLQRGGDTGALHLIADGVDRRLAGGLPPASVLAGVVTLKGPPPRAARLESAARGEKIVAAAPALAHLPPAWLRPWAAAGSKPGAPSTLLMKSPSVVALVEPVLHAAAPADEVAVKGSMDRMVVRNVLSLAYMPRARACYLNRTGATPALRDLSGKVRLAIDLVRGEVSGASIESSTLDNPDIERCLKESAFEIEVPRAARSDAPVTAVLNMVFRPRTPDKKADVDLGAVGDQIDLVIEEMRRRDARVDDGAPAH